MSEQSHNEKLDFSARNELVKNLTLGLERVSKSLRQVILAMDQLSRSLASAPGWPEIECVPTNQKRHQINQRYGHEQDFRFFDEGSADLQPIVSAVIEQSDKNEIYRKPSDLLEIARNVGALPWKIASIRPTGDKDKRAERAALGRCLEINKGRKFTVRIGETVTKVKFEAIGQGHTRKYKFIPCNQ
jgi:hypothetical protein